MDQRRPGKIVADSSALAAVVMEENGWEKILEVLEENIVYSVDFAWAECTNVLWKAREPERIRRLKATMKLVDSFASSGDLAENALHIATAKGIPIYDAMFIALAEMERATMITRDEKQARIARTLGIDAIIV